MKRRRLEELFAPHEDVLYCIFIQLDLRDCIRMGAVCKSWLSVSKWSIITRSPQLPWLMILPNFNSESWCNIRARSQLSWRMRLFNPNSNPIPAEIEENSLTKEEKELRCFLSISDNTIYDNIKFPEISGKRCCGSFHNAGARGWLMFINDDNLEMQLFHPWRRIQLQLPHHSTLQRERPFIDRSRNPLVVELKIRKSAMSDDESLLVVIHDFWYLGFWRKGTSERVCDVIYHKGKFYALSPMGSVGVVRFDTHKAYLEIITEKIELDHYQTLYLVADSVSESFFIFVRKCLVLPEAIEEAYVFRKTWGFKVYELGVEKTGEYKKNPVKWDASIQNQSKETCPHTVACVDWSDFQYFVRCFPDALEDVLLSAAGS
ncbi:F-box-like protein [Cinnamomum micranthum f. kanehirae]|uniref:F-box-like protein n=1 Tax=Cinnamomum micranthum f. kanehirae TaxID=337451 RepID=A0A443PFT1_9MAGN|nr:F-box-like protein [Cinnamomum micranthum f. kanehirae]